MNLSELIAPDAIIPALKANSKKQVLQILAEKAARLTGLNERTVSDIILQREKLGSTGLGDGVAIPHGKLPGIDRIIGIFAHLENPVDFEAVDDRPVDLIFLLLVPENASADHLKALSKVARVLRCPDIAQKLRNTHDSRALYTLLIQNSAPSTA
ncbi:nitrogen regulatory IIA [Bartonella australis AUST/NH1]|uniref:Nitrogen regulatory IIA n=1 Tax=Bartonella australis (strain Aust/NH1) TaxID=1094489 RepID=M1PB75_BARAA|nr:PTS IIA-like nitrogen regulatory protein PtsN [Bartonella australis]AGF73911.1 nitrogen regulatory IIA [Bartonella australis AUST/NH1]